MEIFKKEGHYAFADTLIWGHFSKQDKRKKEPE